MTILSVICLATDGREIAFYYVATKGLKPEDVEKLKRRYRTTWRGTGTDGGLFSWESANGLSMVAERHEGYDYAGHFRHKQNPGDPEIRNAVPAPALASAPVATSRWRANSASCTGSASTFGFRAG